MAENHYSLKCMAPYIKVLASIPILTDVNRIRDHQRAAKGIRFVFFCYVKKYKKEGEM